MMTPPPRVLVISEFTAGSGESSLFTLLQEYRRDKPVWISQTIMDTYMKPLPDNVTLAILDVGLITGIHREVLDKLLLEGRMPVLAHVTDDRPEVLKFLRGHDRIWYLKKPASLQAILETVQAAADGAQSPGSKPTGTETGP